MILTPAEFEHLVSDGAAAIPERFRKLMQNVAIVIADEPTPIQLRKLQLKPGVTLFGLYEGVPQTKRNLSYSGALPDKITIFKGPIERAAVTEEEIKNVVRDTVWHEIAHHFGMDEASVRRSAQKRRQRSKTSP